MAEFSDADIQTLYWKLLKRTAHAGELDYWHANATTLAGLRKGIKGSSEYKTRVEPIKDRTLAGFLGAVAAGLYLLAGLLLALMMGVEIPLALFVCLAFGPAAVGAVLLVLCLPVAELYLMLAERRRTAAAKRTQGEDLVQQKLPTSRAAEVSP